MVAGGGHTLVQKFSGALSDVKSISPARGLVHIPIGDTATGLPKDENYTLPGFHIEFFPRGEGGGGEGGWRM